MPKSMEGRRKRGEVEVANQTTDDPNLQCSKSTLRRKAREGNETDEERILRRARITLRQRNRRAKDMQQRSNPESLSDEDDTEEEILKEIKSMKMWVEAIRSAALSVIIHHVKIAVKKIGGGKGENWKDREERLLLRQLRRRRENETEEQYRLRLEKQLQNDRVRRAKESEEQRRLRLEKQRKCDRTRRANESEEQHRLRLDRQRDRARARRANESEKKRLLRLEQQRQYKLRRLANETEEETKKRLEINREHVRRHRANETEEESRLRRQELRKRIKLSVCKNGEGERPEKEEEEFMKITEGMIGIPIQLVDNYSQSDAGESSAKMYVCVVCKNQFTTESGLIMHSRLHTALEITKAKLPTEKEQNSMLNSATKNSDGPETFVARYDCKLCSESFIATSTFKQHLVEVHRENKEVLKEFCSICSICGEAFENKRYLVHHQRDVHEIFNQCPICNENIKSQELFTQHIMETHSDVHDSKLVYFKFDGKYFCKFCGYTHRAPHAVSSHFYKLHSEIKSFQCDKCEQKFAFSKDLDLHNKKVHELKEHCCDICGKQFAMTTSLNRHVREKHEKHSKKSTVACDECPLTFTAASSLRVHKWAIHRKVNRFQCQVCGKAFACNSTLHIHKILVCEKEKAKCATCPICGKIFDNYIFLGHHKTNIHTYGNIEETVCHVCNKTYKSASCLLSHNKLCHQANKISTKNKNVIKSQLKCADCEKVFPGKELLFDHWRTHRKEKPFQCSLCSATYKQSSAFYLHRKIKHKNEKESANKIIDALADKKLKEDFMKAHASQLEKVGDGQVNTDRKTVDNEPEFVDNVGELNEISQDNGAWKNNGVHLMEMASSLDTTGQVDNTDQGTYPVNLYEYTVVFDSNEGHQENKGNGSADFNSEEANVDILRNISLDIPVINSEIILQASFEEPLQETEELECSVDHEIDELNDGHVSQDSSFSVHGEEELQSGVDCKDFKTRTIFSEKPFYQDICLKKLIVKLDKLKEYSCSACDVIFYSAKLYRKHLGSKSHRSALKRVKSIKCNYCPKLFTFPYRLRQHIKSVHEKNQEIELFSTEDDSGLKKSFICEFCGLEFESIIKLHGHLRNHKNKQEISKSAPEKTFQCDQCPKLFTLVSSLQRHIAGAHLKPQYLCPECGKEFGFKMTFQRHLKIEHGGPESKWICEQCQSSFKEKRSLVDHVNNIHLKIKLTCKICGAVYTNRSLFNRHKRSHATNQCNLCSICSKTFITQKAYDDHIKRLHDPSRPFACDQCYSFYSHKSNLIHHKKNAHLKLGIVYKKKKKVKPATTQPSYLQL